MKRRRPQSSSSSPRINISDSISTTTASSIMCLMTLIIMTMAPVDAWTTSSCTRPVSARRMTTTATQSRWNRRSGWCLKSHDASVLCRRQQTRRLRRDDPTTTTIMRATTRLSSVADSSSSSSSSRQCQSVAASTRRMTMMGMVSSQREQDASVDPETQQQQSTSSTPEPAVPEDTSNASTSSSTSRSSKTKNSDPQSFLEHVHKAMDTNSLLSLTLRWSSSIDPKQAAAPQDDSLLRGSLRMLVARPILLADSTQKRKKNNNNNNKTETSPKRRIMQVTFKYHRATDIAKNWEWDEFRTNLAAIFPLGDDNNDNDQRNSSNNNVSFIRIVPVSEWDTTSSSDEQASLQHSRPILRLQSATLVTVAGIEWELLQIHTGKPKLRCRTRNQQQQQSVSSSSATSNAVPYFQQHDRIKHMGSPIALDAPLWKALSVTNAQGQLRPGMSSKFRQCQKFVEIVERLVRSTFRVVPPPTKDEHGSSSSSSTPSQRLSVVDMGCGRAYLTFALHVALQASCSSTTMTVHSRGIDVRPKLVREASSTASALNLTETLSFETGTIDSFLADSNNNNNNSTTPTDILIALHACDTATDDALWSGLCRGARVLVVAPCCHRQVRPQLDRHAAAAVHNLQHHHHHPLADVWRHNIYRERMAEMVTDALRALLLEYAGYQVQVFEFVGGEHTSKNVMITAVKMPSVGTTPTPTPTGNDHSKQVILLERIQALAALHGIQEQKLAEWMGIDLVSRKDDDNPTKTQGATRPPLSVRSMPPRQK